MFNLHLKCSRYKVLMNCESALCVLVEVKHNLSFSYFIDFKIIRTRTCLCANLRWINQVSSNGLAYRVTSLDLKATNAYLVLHRLIRFCSFRLFLNESLIIKQYFKEAVVCFGE